MSNSEIAFFIGLFGSVHCVGMCGPLAFAVPFTGNTRWLLVWDKLLYQFGRVISYAVLGALTGLIGKQLWLAGMQQGISIAGGVLIVLAASSRLLKVSFLKSNAGVKLLAPFTRFLTYAVQHRAGHLLIGMLNGLLPCGFVYLALVGAINTGSVLSSVNFMVWFGLGTVPLMLAATLGAGFFNPSLRHRMNKVVPYFMLLLGVWFILRGLALDIPYVSPPKATDTAVCR